MVVFRTCWEGHSEIVVVQCLWFRRARATGVIPRREKREDTCSFSFSFFLSHTFTHCLLYLHITVHSLSFLSPKARGHSRSGQISYSQRGFRGRKRAILFSCFSFSSLHRCHSGWFLPEDPLSKGSETVHGLGSAFREVSWQQMLDLLCLDEGLTLGFVLHWHLDIQFIIYVCD